MSKKEKIAGEKMKLYDSGICYWAGKNPCTDCRDKSKCLECDKSFEYVLSIHNEIVKNIKENKNFLDK